MLRDRGGADSASESEDWFGFFFHNGKVYDLKSSFGRLSGIRTHSLSNLTTRAMLLSMILLVWEDAIPSGGRKTGLVVVAIVIRCRW